MKANIHANAGLLLLVILCCCTPQAIAQIAPGVTQSAAQTATVTGTVFRSDGTPVSNADLHLDGPNAHLATITDTHGVFVFTTVPFGVYSIVASSEGLGVASRVDIAIKGDTSVAIQYAAPTSGMKEIARVSTSSAGAQINVTPASIASVSPTQYALAGNATWKDLLNGIPGVTVGGGLGAGLNSWTGAPGSPFETVILSINGALPYETSTTFDGMPLSNYTFNGASPGGGVDLSTLPMPLFETADIVRGPGANAPSIVDSIGGSFVLHAPGPVDKDSFAASLSNDPYGGYYSNMKLAFKRGKLSGTVVYGFNNSPGPLGSGSEFGAVSPVTINGNTVATGGPFAYQSSSVYGSCFCVIDTTLVGTGGYATTAWRQHNGGIGLSYQLTPTVTMQAFYAGSQGVEYQPSELLNLGFAPDVSYSGQISPGTYPGAELSTPANPVTQAGSLFEEKMTAYLGRGVLRLAALQNATYWNHLFPETPGGTVQLYGTGTYCADPNCLTTTPFAFNGQSATVTYFQLFDEIGGRSTNNDLLASYEIQIGSYSNLGISFVKSATSANCSYIEELPAFDVTSSGGVPTVTETTNEFRLHAGTQLSETFSLDASYYFANATYHVPNPQNPARWVDSPFSYGTPRIGLTWRADRNTVFRIAAGGGFALPPLLNLVGANGPPLCNPTTCTQSLTNINLQPEKSFGFDLGTDLRLRRDTALALDFYHTDLYGQLFQSVNFIGPNPIPGSSFGLPVYAQEYLNLAHSRFEGVTFSIDHNVRHGIYWNAGLGLTRGYIINVPPGFYNQAGTTCNFTTGIGCQNTYAVPNQNFNGEYQSSVPYANGNGVIGYRWSERKYFDIQANYQGNNNAYFQPAFVEFDAHGSYPLTRNFSLIATFRNITGVYDQNYQVLAVNPNLLAPSVAGFEFPLYPIPYGPRTLVVTANISL